MKKKKFERAIDQKALTLLRHEERNRPKSALQNDYLEFPQVQVDTNSLNYQ